jgi:hypothetical protein
MKKIFYILTILIFPLFIDSCYVQQEVEIYRHKKEKLGDYVHKKQTVKDGLFSKNRKMRTRHKYLYKDSNGKWHYIPLKERRDFIHYKRTGGVIGTGGKVRIIKRGTVAIPKKSKKKR